MGEIRIVGPGKTCGYPYPVLWQAKCTIIRETKVYKAKTMVLTINLG